MSIFTAEQSTKYQQFRDFLSQNHIPTEDFRVLSTDSTGTHCAVWNRNQKTWSFWLVSDLTPLSFTFDNSKQLETSLYDNLGNPLVSLITTPTAITRGLVVRLAGALNITNPVTLVGSSIVQIKDSTGLSITADSHGDLQSVPGQVDGANNSYAQTTVGAAAVQLVTSGTLFRELHVKNISATQKIYLGFDNLVTTANGYELNNLGTTDDEKIFYGFNANLWAIASAAGGTVSIIGRG